jgi:hypothetical protein
LFGENGRGLYRRDWSLLLEKLHQYTVDALQHETLARLEKFEGRKFCPNLFPQEIFNIKMAFSNYS